MANAFVAYSNNYLIDTDHGVRVDVEATRSIRQAEVGSTKTMLNRVKERFDLHPERILGLGRLRLRAPCGANGSNGLRGPTGATVHSYSIFAATAQNLRKRAKIFSAPQQTRKA